MDHKGEVERDITGKVKRQMKVLVDFQILCLQKYGGVSKYTYNMMREIAQDKEIEFVLPVLVSINGYFRDVIKGWTTSIKFRGMKRILQCINKVYTLLYVMTHDVDIYHPTYYDPYLLWLCQRRGIKVVVTIHDMIHEIFADDLSDAGKTVPWKKQFIDQSDVIIAVSQNTKKDILNFYPDIDPDKIKVIYEGGICDERTEPVEHLPAKYILYIGKRSYYKNFRLFMRAVSDILREDGYDLLCIGGGPFSEEERELMQGLAIEDKVIWMDCTERELNDIYQKATLFVYPSLYEGFGIPLLEAFANQCPVVCSQTSSLPEIAEGGAVYFAPTDETDLFKKVSAMIRDEKLRIDHISEGRKRADFFSWQKMGQEIREVYYHVISL